MAKQLDPALVEILKKYHPNPKEAVWDCRDTWVIYHKACELIAAKAGVKFDPPMVIVADSHNKHVALCVTGWIGDISAWSIGEASPGNNKNSYPFAMAEKRAKDRVVLKLVGLHGYIYAEDESDDFAPPAEEDEPAKDQKQTPIERALSRIKAANTAAELQALGDSLANDLANERDKDVAAVRAEFSRRKKQLAEAA